MKNSEVMFSLPLSLSWSIVKIAELLSGTVSVAVRVSKLKFLFFSSICLNCTCLGAKYGEFLDFYYTAPA